MLLTDIPGGTRVMIDANILVYHRVRAAGLTSASTNFLERVERGEVTGHTSTALVAEVVHKIMLAEAVQQHGLPEKGVVSRLKQKPELVTALTHTKVTDDLKGMRIAIELVTPDLLSRAEELVTTHGLLTNDSITLALMEKLGISDIATNDDDFDGVDWVTVWKPR